MIATRFYFKVLLNCLVSMFHSVLFVYWQGLSVLLAMLLKALGPHPYRHYDSDDEYNVSTVALLQDARQPPPYVVGEPMYGAKPGAWTVRINERANR